MGRPYYAGGEDDAARAVSRTGRDDPRPGGRRGPRPSPARGCDRHRDRPGSSVDSPERVEVSTEAAMPSYLVLADTFDPGWSAILDGRPAPIRPAFVAFRAVYVPAGRHRVIFRYRPSGFATGLRGLDGRPGAVVALFAWPRRVFAPGTMHGDPGWPASWPWWGLAAFATDHRRVGGANRARGIDRHPGAMGRQPASVHLGESVSRPDGDPGAKGEGTGGPSPHPRRGRRVASVS